MLNYRINLLFPNKFDFNQIIQAYAIQKFLKRSFFGKFIINDNTVEVVAPDKKSNKYIGSISFIEKNLKMNKFNKEDYFDKLIIAGFNSCDYYSLIKYTGHQFIKDYFLSELPRSRKISLATSFSTTKLDMAYLEFLKSHIEFFNIDMVNEYNENQLFDKSYSMYSPNPVIFLNKEDYTKFEKEPIFTDKEKEDYSDGFYAVHFNNYNFDKVLDKPLIKVNEDDRFGPREVIWLLNHSEKIFTNDYITFLFGMLFCKSMVYDSYNSHIATVMNLINPNFKKSYKSFYNPEDEFGNFKFLDFKTKEQEKTIECLSKYFVKKPF